MALNSSEAVVAVTGSLTSFPTSVVPDFGVYAAAPSTSVEHGFVSEDGVTISSNRTTSPVTAWQNSSAIRIVTTESELTIQFTLLQTNEDNKELYFGKKKNTNTGGYHWEISKNGVRRSWFLDAIDEATNTKIRYYIPSGEVTELGDMQLTSSDVIGYNVTLTAYPVEVAGENANAVVWEGVFPQAGS